MQRICKIKFAMLMLGVVLLVTGCAPAPPRHALNACEIFTEYPNWYWAAKDSEAKWGVPVHVQLAIILEESSFKANAKPPRGKLLWFIPWKRPTSASGYAQAVNQTWSNYKICTGHSHASRSNFKDATDFIGWYGCEAHKRLGIPRNNAYDLYLAYHEGMGGYERGTYQKQPWLMGVAHKVQANASRYQRQLATCSGKFKKSWWDVW